jgi:hypothetical protein
LHTLFNSSVFIADNDIDEDIIIIKDIKGENVLVTGAGSGIGKIYF